ncbi:MAG: trigger factor [Ilumatobacteraceae bacterium]
MKSSIQTIDDPRTEQADDSGEQAAPRQLVKLSVVVESDEFAADIDRAFKKIARQVRLPGFRPGKAPRKVLEAHVGIDAARGEAINDALPVYLAKAVREHDIDLIATPEVELTSGMEGGDVQFDAVCEVRPVITVPGYGGLRVELPTPHATDAEVDEAVEAERRRNGTLVLVDRPAGMGDHVTLDLSASRDGEPVPGLNTEDWVYEVGKGWVAASFDGFLIGASAGAELSFTDTPSGTEIPADFTVKVSAVQEMVLPEVTDEWVAEHVAEHDSVAAWRDSIAARLGDARLNQARNVFIERLTSALADLVDAPVPQSMVNGDLQARVQNTVRQFQAQGISIEQLLQITGQSEAQFVGQLRDQSVKAVKVDLALRAVALAEGMQVSDDDLEREYRQIGLRSNQKASQVQRAYEQNDAVTDLISMLLKNKALDWLVEHVEIVDTEGAPIERTLLIGERPDDDHDHHDHDHHDHDGHDHEH